MVLRIDIQTVNRTYAEKENQSIFDTDTYLFIEKAESEFAVNPVLFPSIPRTEPMRKFVDTLGRHRHFKNLFSGLNDEEYFKLFWNVFDDGGEMLGRYNIFEDRYRLDKVVEWCEDNGIAYYIDKSDRLLQDLINEN